MRAIGLAVLVMIVATGLVGACGARTGLLADGSSPAAAATSSAFCVRVDFPSGYDDVGIYVLLDSSLSMDEGSKWDDATAALGALVDDPAAAGLEIGLQYFPLGDDCDPDRYAKPAVPLDFLPGNAEKIKASLAGHKPDGNTPTTPAMRGAIAYVRALRIADPSRDIAVVLVTDGAPDTCQSTTRTVVEVTTEGATADPRVSTFVVGLANGYVNDMNRIAAAGGTGEAILISADPTTAQRLVTTLKAVRDTRRFCRYAVPAAGAAQPTALDLSVTTQLSPDVSAASLPIVAGPDSCGGASGFYVDDVAKPKTVALCPQSCAAVHGDTRSRVQIVVGCGEGAPDGGAIDLDAGPCRSLDFFCTPACGSSEVVAPVCFAGQWTCPPGAVAADSCMRCPATPHGCCKPDGTLATASCVAGAWVCPPGASIFGTAGCKPPDVCAASLPCAPGQYCKVPDSSCGNASVPGTCAPVPAGCPGQNTPVCGCDGNVYGSACLASAAGSDVSVAAGCAAPAGTFRCGPVFCRLTDEVCRKTTVLATSIGPDSYACVPQSSACIQGCNPGPLNRCSLCDACPAQKTCGFTCGAEASGGRTLDCTVL